MLLTVRWLIQVYHAYYRCYKGHWQLRITCNPPCRLELWPGFATAIQQYEKQIMLCAEVTHKILRTDTVYDFLNDLYVNRPRTFHDDAIRGLVGEIVLTRYVEKESLSMLIACRGVVWAGPTVMF